MTFLPPTNFFFILADILQILVYLIIIEVLVSWAVTFGKVSSRAIWVITLRRITDPVLGPFRKVLPSRGLGGLDISPILAIVLINILMGLLTKLGS
jgi:YggT family protein